jgi:hypothetical protein
MQSPVLLWWAEAVNGLNHLPQNKRKRLVSRLTQELHQIIPYHQDISFPCLSIHGPDSICLETRPLRPDEMSLQTELQSIFDKPSPLDQLKPVFRRTLEQQCADGIPLQYILNSLGQILEQLQEQMAQPEDQSLCQQQQEWIHYVERERQRLFGIMANRNLKGKHAEHQGDITTAIELYETNLHDQFTGPYPYERLRVIYTRQAQYTDAIRVCCAYLNLPGRPHEQNREHFQHHLERLAEIEGTKKEQ